MTKVWIAANCPFSRFFSPTSAFDVCRPCQCHRALAVTRTRGPWCGRGEARCQVQARSAPRFLPRDRPTFSTFARSGVKPSQVRILPRTKISAKRRLPGSEALMAVYCWIALRMAQLSLVWALRLINVPACSGGGVFAAAPLLLTSCGLKKPPAFMPRRFERTSALCTSRRARGWCVF